MKLTNLFESDRRTRSLEHAADAGDSEAYEQYLMARAREGIEPKPADLKSNPVRKQINKLSIDRNKLETETPHLSPDNYWSDRKIDRMEQILNAEQRPFEEFTNSGVCASCGDPNRFTYQDTGLMGDPDQDMETRNDPDQAGILETCYNCGHRIFWQPKNWPPKGKRSKHGDWEWSSQGKT